MFFDWLVELMYGSSEPDDSYTEYDEIDEEVLEPMYGDDFDCENDLHDWGTWKVICEGHLTDDDDQIIGRFLDQQRSCDLCGKTVLDTQQSTI